MNSSRTNKAKIMQDIEQLIQKIKERLNKSYLLCREKKTNTLPQPKGLVGGKLKDYQLQSLAWMVQLANNNLSGILADDMGLGKTIQTIAYFTYVKDVKGIKGKHLLVVPKNVINNWKRQLEKWNPTFNAIVLPGTQAQRQQCLKQYVKPSKFDIIISTYQSVQACQRQLRRFMFQTLVVDQAHSIKNDQTCLASCLRRLRFQFSLLLTGTPLSNELKQLWSLLNFIVPDLFNDDTLFVRIQDSVNSQCKDEQQKIKFQTQIAGKFKAIISPFLLRRVKSQINLGLKQKRQFTLFVSLTQLQLKMYRNYLKFHSVYGNSKLIQHGRFIQLRKICAHPYLFSQIQDPNAPPYGQHLIQNSGKLKLLDKLLQKLLKEGHKILIFSQFVIVLKVLEDYCTYRNYKYSSITGQTDLQERDEAVQNFSKSKDVNIFLISTRAGGIGLNLVAADVVIIYDIDWNPQMDKQATDRAYRIGQEKNVLVFKIITNNTVQQRMLQVQKYKLIWDELVIQKGGLARMKEAEDKLQKIDHNYIAGLHAEQIFKLQQNYDDKTIDQIIKIGEEKDKKKTEKIRAELQKQFQKYGEIPNPFQSLNNVNSGVQKIEYNAEKVGYASKSQISRKPNWKQRKQAGSKYIHPKAYHLFQDQEKAGQILYLLENQDQDNQKESKYEKELNKLGFYSWSKSQYQLFIQANLKYESTNYQQISKYIKTKSIKQVENYSKKYFEIAINHRQLSKDYKKITNAQKALSITKKTESLEQKIIKFPSNIFNLKSRSSVQAMNVQTLTRMYYNQLKDSGINLQEHMRHLQLVIPNSVTKNQRNFKTQFKKMHTYEKLQSFLDNKSYQQWENLLEKRYQVLVKMYKEQTKQQSQDDIDMKMSSQKQQAQTHISKKQSKSRPKAEKKSSAKLIKQTNQESHSNSSIHTALKS